MVMIEEDRIREERLTIQPRRLTPVPAGMEEDKRKGHYNVRDLVLKCLRDNGRMAWESNAQRFLGEVLERLESE